MPSLKRSLAMPLDEVGVYHCFNRCVQQAYLCGYDREKQIDYSHRKAWMRDKLRQLAGAFAVDLFKYSLMDNHLHLIVRNRPDLVRMWTDQEVVRRWWQVCPERVESDGSAAEPQAVELEHWLNDADRVMELRARLSNPSWLMRIWCSYIGRRANRETDKGGRFFAERYKSVRLLDEAAVLACAFYIDLNPVRACRAETPEQSAYTSVSDRIAGRRQRLARALAQGLDVSALSADGGLPLDVICADPSDDDAWLSRLTLDAERRLNSYLAEWFTGAETLEWDDFSESEGRDSTDRGVPPSVEEALSDPQLAAVHRANDEGPTAESEQTSGTNQSSVRCHRTSKARDSLRTRSGVLHFPAPRASNKGFLSLTFDEYLELLDWTGRQLQAGKRGVIPETAPPILERLGIRADGWLKLVENLRDWFGVAVGKVQQLEQEATRVGRRWLWRRHQMEDAYG